MRDEAAKAIFEDASALVRALRERGAMIAVAESITGGLVGGAITDVPGASQAFAGGLLAYTPEAKARLLNIDPAEGSVGPKVTARMALAARTLSGAEVGLALTGYAGPGGEAGLVYIAVAAGERVRVEESRFPGDRDHVRRAAVRSALRMALEAVTGVEK